MMTAPRHIQAFLSSTFLDMRAERDYLAAMVFPRMRRYCEARGVVWNEVDLRWGIPEENVADGSVVRLCLTEVDRCRPFFIGLIGDRYGSAVELPHDVVGQFPWLSEYAGCSVAELEVVHGFLRNPAEGTFARFYFRASDSPSIPATVGSSAVDDRAPRSRVAVL
jgi:hypothetical protein